MFNLEETLSISDFYKKQNDFLGKLFFFLFPVLIFLNIFRAQISETAILQLVPGTYLIFLFLFLIFLIFFSTLFYSFSKWADNINENGTKVNNRIVFFLRIKYSIFLFSICYLLSIFNVIPLSLDSFNAYGEKTLESLWSFTEIFLLEFTLSFLLISFFQFPLFFVSWISLEKKIQNLSKLWKLISFFSFLIAGIITPTLDSSIQFFLALISICFYFATILFIQKRINIKISGFSLLS
jgi:hypothetical protein